MITHAVISRVRMELEEQTSSRASQRQPPVLELREVPAAQQKRMELALTQNKAGILAAGKLPFVPTFIYILQAVL